MLCNQNESSELLIQEQQQRWTLIQPPTPAWLPSPTANHSALGGRVGKPPDKLRLGPAAASVTWQSFQVREDSSTCVSQAYMAAGFIKLGFRLVGVLINTR